MASRISTEERHWLKLASWWSGPWWLVLAKGIMAITMGILAFVWPGPTLLALLLIFGIFAIVDGIFTIMVSAAHRKSMPGWGWSLAAGIFGSAIGFFALLWPSMTGLVLLLLIAAWMLIAGTFNIVNAVIQRKEIPKWPWILATGIFSIIFTILIIANPIASAVALVWIWGTFGIVYGILMCIQAYLTRRLSKVEGESSKSEVGKQAV
jgi:uncharacterized membrane protein HdeD (DUF308 family)